MPHVAPPYTRFDYRVSRNPDGTPYVGRYDDGRPYYNILALRRGAAVTNQHRVIARTETLQQAEALVAALTVHTHRKDEQ